MDAARKVFDAGKSGLLDAYRNVLGSGLAVDDGMMVRLTVAPSGAVTGAVVRTSTSPNPELDAAAVKTMMGLDFRARSTAAKSVPTTRSSSRAPPPRPPLSIRASQPRLPRSVRRFHPSTPLLQRPCLASRRHRLKRRPRLSRRRPSRNGTSVSPRRVRPSRPCWSRSSRRCAPIANSTASTPIPTGAW